VSFSQRVSIDGGTTQVRIRYASMENPGDTGHLANLWARLSDPGSQGEFPLAGVGMRISDRQWDIAPGCLVAAPAGTSGTFIATAVPHPMGDTARLVLWVDPQWRDRGLEQPLAEALLECTREAEAPGGPFRRVVTASPQIAGSLKGFRALGDGNSDRWLRPWLPWGEAGTPTARTLVIVHKGGARRDPTAEDLSANLLWADGGEADVIVTADEDDPLTMMHPGGPGGLSLEFHGRPYDTITRDEIGAVTGTVPLSFSQWIELMWGRPKNIEFKHLAAVKPVVEYLRRRGVPFDEVLATSFLEEAVIRAGNLGLRTGLLIGRRGMRVRDWRPASLLQATGASFVALNARQRRLGVLNRSGGRPGVVWTVNGDHEIDEAVNDHSVHGLISDEPQRARQRLLALIS
jgi:hypothetical protein